jgi:hypothetical protein
MVKFHRIAGQECLEGKCKYSCTLSLTSELDGDVVCGQRQSLTELRLGMTPYLLCRMQGGPHGRSVQV